MSDDDVMKELNLTADEFNRYLDYSKADIYFEYVRLSQKVLKKNLEAKDLNIKIAGLNYDIKKMKEEKLQEILEYYRDNFTLTEEIDVIKKDLIKNNVEIQANSFYCQKWEKELSLWILLAGTKDRADIWVLKKIIKLIKTGDTIISALNGNSKYLLPKLKRYGVEIIKQENGITIVLFNKKGDLQWQHYQV